MRRNIVMGISREDSVSQLFPNNVLDGYYRTLFLWYRHHTRYSFQFPDGSELTKHLSLITDIWKDLPASVDVVVIEPDLNDAVVRQRIQNLTLDLENQ